MENLTNVTYDVNQLIDFINIIPDGLELVPIFNKSPHKNGEGWQTKRYPKRHVEREVKANNANGVGVMLGKGWLIIDIDGANGRLLVEALAGMPFEEALPSTLCHWSSHRPDHVKYLLWVNDGVNFKGKRFTEWGSVAAIPGEQMELLYTGRQAVLPFSYHPGVPEKGIEPGIFHNWNVAPDTDAALNTPQWVINLIQSLAEPKPTTPNPSDYLNAEFEGDSEASEAYVNAALESECQKVSTAPEGTRNRVLNTAAYNLATLIDQGLAEDVIRRRLLNCAKIANISASEANKTISSGIKAGKKKPRKPKEKEDKKEELGGSKLAGIIADMWRDKVCYTNTTRSFYRYSDGVWEPRDDEDVLADIQEILEDGLVEQYSHRTVLDQFNILKGKLRKTIPNMPRHLIPMKNVVLNAKTMEQLPHSPEYWFNAKIPFDYSPDAECPIAETQVFPEILPDTGCLLVILSYFKAIILGWTHLQKYLELIGAPGSGKSTIVKIAEALVGHQWSTSKMLNFLENNRFETASLKGKRLLTINDVQQYSDDIKVLKMITGQDPLPYEQKNKNPGDPFKAECLVIITSNHPLATSESAALERRRITINFDRQIPENKRVEILELKNDGSYTGILANEIPGIFNWILNIPDDVAEDTLRNYTSYKINAEAKLNNLIETNKIAAWVHECLVVSPGYNEYVGIKPNIDPTVEDNYVKDDSGGYVITKGIAHADNLYPNYHLWMQAHELKPASVHKFSKELKELLCYTLKLDDVEHTRDNKGKFFRGIATRGQNGNSKHLLDPLTHALLKPHDTELGDPNLEDPQELPNLSKEI